MRSTIEKLERYEINHRVTREFMRSTIEKLESL